jgi:hypothetical protein
VPTIAVVMGSHQPSDAMSLKKDRRTRESFSESLAELVGNDLTGLPCKLRQTIYMVKSIYVVHKDDGREAGW